MNGKCKPLASWFVDLKKFQEVKVICVSFACDEMLNFYSQTMRRYYKITKQKKAVESVEEI